MAVPVATSAASRFGRTSRSARLRTLNWMLKSTPSPTNSGMKATEIRLKRPTASRPMAAVMTRPISVVQRIAIVMRVERTASQRMPTSAVAMATVIRPASSASEANSSSASGTWPVRRTVTP